ncbi:MAG TPA: glycosyltransferase [Planctomycetota bacterium]|nr:glycosyltransferase [Planctomycetota bacterium]
MDVSLVVPAYNAEPLLRASLERARAWLRTLGGATEIVVVDDGSTDGTLRVLENFGRDIRVLHHAPNRGKGYAVQRGLLQARGRFRVFLDAGETYPIENVATVVEALQAGADVAVASRVHPESQHVTTARSFRTLCRQHLMGPGFSMLARALVRTGVSDTQAGLKGFRAEAAEWLFRRVTLERFCFDVEVCLLARRLGLHVAEVPVHFVHGGEKSTLRPLRDGARMFKDLLRIRANARRGVYDVEPQRISETASVSA